jgi:hypothetical protein
MKVKKTYLDKKFSKYAKDAAKKNPNQASKQFKPKKTKEK